MKFAIQNSLIGQNTIIVLGYQVGTNGEPAEEIEEDTKTSSLFAGGEL